MALYMIGDVQGCDQALDHLLQTVDFSPSRDTIYLLGDLVNRGPDSLAVLRRLMGYGAAAQCVLGNHDLHLLAVANGVRHSSRKDTLQQVLDAPDRKRLLDWLRTRPLAIQAHGILMVHAGVLPDWSATETIANAQELERILSGKHYAQWLSAMYGDQPAAWHPELRGNDRLRVIVNALTRLRFCSADGTMEFATKEAGSAPPAGFIPWFDVPGRRSFDTTIAFGHWSTLGLVQRPNLISLDTGCVWGGCLSALRFGASEQERELIQVKCAQAQVPG